jgi:hypothetical protein
MAAARGAIKVFQPKGVIVCLHSWSAQERDSIADELATSYPNLAVIMRCPGCVGCDAAAHIPGALPDTFPLTRLISTLLAAKI